MTRTSMADPRPSKRSKVALDRGEDSSPAVFERMIEAGGLAILSEGGEAHIIREPATLRWKLEQELKHDPGSLQQFLAGLNEMLETESFFMSCLLPSQSGNQNQGNEFSIQPQDSLLRVLLGVPSLQNQVISLMLEKIPEFFELADNSSMRTDIPRLILHQLRWLDTVFDELALAETLLETMDVCPESLQKEIILAIPEIVTDSTHELVVSRLHSLMTENISMTTCVLDTLSNLNLESSLCKQVSDCVLKVIDATSIDDLPVVIRFLLKNSDKDNVDTVCEHIMKSLRFIGQGRHNGKRDQQSLVFVIEALQHGVRFHKQAAQSLLKILSSSRIEAPIHCWLLLMLVSNDGHRKKAETALKKRVLEGTLPISLFKKSVTSHKELIAMLSRPAVTTADVLVQSHQPKLERAGAALYKCIFEMHEDTFTRQDVINNIVCHAGSGVESEINTALCLLLSLVQENCSIVASFFTFVKVLMDYADVFSASQLRLMFRVVCTLETTRNTGDETSIVIQKLLFNSKFSTKSIGIIGALSLLSCHHSSEHAVISESHKDLIKTLVSHANSSHDVAAFFFDELIQCARQRSISKHVLNVIHESMSESFVSLFLCLMEDTEEISLPSIIHPDLGHELWWNLDADQTPVAINITSALLSPEAAAKEALGSVCQALEFHVYCNPDKENFDCVLLGCPLALFEFEKLQTLDELDEDIFAIAISSLFFAMNWIRSSLNCHVQYQHKDKFIAWKLCRRIHHLLFLESQFDRLQSSSSSLVPIGITQYQKKVLIASKKSKSENSGDCKLFSISRRFWPCVYNILTWPLSLSKSQSDAEVGVFSSENCPEAQLHIDTLSFLLIKLEEDLKSSMSKPAGRFAFKLRSTVPKIEAVLDPIEFLSRMESESHLPNNQISVRSSVVVWKAVGQHMMSISKILNGEDRLDEPFEGSDTMLCSIFERCLEILNHFVHTSFFDLSDDQDSLAAILLAFSGVQEENASLPSARKHLFQFLLSLRPEGFCHVDLSVRTVSLLRHLLSSRCSDEHNLKVKLSELAEQLLNVNWDSNTKLNSSNVGTLVQVYIEFAPDSLQVVQELTTQHLVSVLRDEGALMFASTLTKKSFIYWYRTCLSQVNSMIISLQKPDFSDFMQCLYVRAEVFSQLTAISTRYSTKPMLAVITANGRVFVDNMLKHFKLLSSKFNVEREIILKTITIAQASTKMLQRICAHAKRNKTSTVLSKIPSLKKSLEQFLLASKNLFAQHDVVIKSGKVRPTTIDGRRYSSSDEDDEPVEEEIEEGGEQNDKGAEQYEEREE